MWQSPAPDPMPENNPQLPRLKGRRMQSNGVIEEFYTLAQVGQLVKRAADTLRGMEQNGQLPPANFRGEEVKLANGSYREGPRLYSSRLARSLVPLFAQIQVGKKIPDLVSQSIKDAFSAEKVRLLP